MEKLKRKTKAELIEYILDLEEIVDFQKQETESQEAAHEALMESTKNSLDKIESDVVALRKSSQSIANYATGLGKLLKRQSIILNNTSENLVVLEKRLTGYQFALELIKEDGATHQEKRFLTKQMIATIEKDKKQIIPIPIIELKKEASALKKPPALLKIEDDMPF